MARKCFISFKSEDSAYKEYMQNNLDIQMIDKSLNDAIASTDEDYILRKIREEYLANSTVTIHLIGSFSAENREHHEQSFIKRELQASLYNAQGNTRNGILGVVLPEIESEVYKGDYSCSRCGGTHNNVGINDSTVVREFSYNYYVPNSKCFHTEEERYCVLVLWGEFCKQPERFIESAFAKRSDPIAEKVRVYGT